MFVVFDLDGTLSDDTHRKHLLPKSENRDNRDWEPYSLASVDDPPFDPVVNLLQTLSMAHEIEIWTGRSIRYMKETTDWLDKQSISGFIDMLRMRPDGDKRSVIEVKGEWLEEQEYPDIIFEDYTKTVNYYRGKGILVCQVAQRDE